MDAAEFMAFLRASNPVWQENDGDPSRWAFRGHRNVAWRLKPHAWRCAAEGNPLDGLITNLATAEVRNDETIKPGKSKEFWVLYLIPPVKTVSARTLSKKDLMPFTEQVVIARIKYSDGSVWQHP